MIPFRTGKVNISGPAAGKTKSMSPISFPEPPFVTANYPLHYITKR